MKIKNKSVVVTGGAGFIGSHLVDLLVKEKPEIVIIGTGVDGLMQVPQQTRNLIASTGAELIVERTAKACELYNLVCDNRKVIAALHLSC